MTNVVRLTNGGTIQVRTGVLQGIGPQGPRGLIGLTGPIGEPGPDGLTGPPGSITQISSKAIVASSQALSAATDTLIAFATVVHDDSSAFTSSTNVTLHDIGDWMITVTATFADPGSATGWRQIKLNSVTNGDLLFDKRVSIVGDTSICQFTFTHRSTISNEVVRVYGRSTQALNVTAGSIVVTRVGSGPPGTTGPAGPTGANGPIGLTGPQGPDGNAGSGFVHYSDLL